MAGKEKVSPSKDEATTGEKPKAKRTVLTPEQKIAKLEANLKAERDKLTEKDRKRHALLTEQKAKIGDKILELQSKAAAIDTELSAIANRVPELNVSSEA